MPSYTYCSLNWRTPVPLTSSSPISSDNSSALSASSDIELRRDVPKYRVYRDGKLHEATESEDIVAQWQDDDHVGFLIVVQLQLRGILG